MSSEFDTAFARSKTLSISSDHGGSVHLAEASAARRTHETRHTDEKTWYKDAVIYEIHVRAFHDSNADGIGDFPGLIQKLDYLQDLGVTAVWLLPFYPSPLRDGGYDIANYTEVNPAYGTLRDFKRFVREAHKRGIRVITELVINHTSSEHPWFQRARRSSPGSKHRDFYVWSDTPDLYADARIIFKDFETSNWTWDPVAKAYYWHRFYSHQPDLNFENPDVHKALFKVLDFWMDMGVDGLRLDAVPYLYEKDGTNCENLPETHTFLKKLRAAIDEKYDNRMLLAEANQWPEDAVSYFGDGDECHMNFQFPLMPRMFMSLQLESSFPIHDILDQTPAIPEVCQWAVFLRNHDELTLEMVTDEDRDYMYKVYTDSPRARINMGIRRRLAPLLKSRRAVELLNGLIFSLPGTPVLYYGDEIGMGDNIYLGDRDGVRTPMQWSGDRNAGFSRANPQKLYLPVVTDPEYHYEAVNVEAHQGNPRSLLWWTKQLIGLRKEYAVFGRGDLVFLHPENSKVLAFVRSLGEERVLVVANLSRFVQCVELDLHEYESLIPVELFGGSEFPAITDAPYFLSIDPHGFFWFELTKTSEKEAAPSQSRGVPTLMPESWDRLLENGGPVERILQDYIVKRRWYRGKAQKVKKISLSDIIPLADRRSALTLVSVVSVEGPSQLYVLPIMQSDGDEAQAIEEDSPGAVIARFDTGDGEAKPSILHDALVSPTCCDLMLQYFDRKKALTGRGGKLQFSASPRFRELRNLAGNLKPRVSSAEQSNTSIVYGDGFVLKILRVLEDGVHPEAEVGAFLTDKSDFTQISPTAGTIEYQRNSGEVASLGILQKFVSNQGDAWELTLDSVARFFEEAKATTELAPEPPTSLLDPDAIIPESLLEMAGAYINDVRLLGSRTAELHLALSQEKEDSAFVPEAFSTLHQRSLYQAGRARLSQTFQRLRKALPKFPNDVAESVKVNGLLERQTDLDAALKRITIRKIDTVRIRCHGDYHLGQVLYTGKDFVIIDFEGEPGRPMNERRFKRSPFRDVTGMLRSFNYAGIAALRDESLRPEDRIALTPWANAWMGWVSAAFLKSYLDAAGDTMFIPQDPDDTRTLVDFYLIEKCLYELDYELNNRPDWLEIPIRGLLSILGTVPRNPPVEKEG